MQRRQEQTCEEHNCENDVISQARRVKTMNTGACLTLVSPLLSGAREIAYETPLSVYETPLSIYETLLSIYDTLLSIYETPLSIYEIPGHSQ